MAQKIRQDVSIGPTIQRLRNASGLTQEQVVAQLEIMGCRVSRSIYSQIELGTYNLRISELIALRQVFGVNYADFFSDLP